MTSQKKHIAFFGRSTFHFSYYKTIISGLGKLDCRVTYYYDQEWSQYASDSDLREFQKNNPTWFTSEPFRILENRRSKFINIVRDLTTLASYFTNSGQSKFYSDRWTKYLPKPWRAYVSYYLVRHFIIILFRLQILQKLNNVFTPVVQETQILEKAKADAAIVSPGNMRFGNEVNFIKAAKKIQIPSMINVLSWDNLSTKGVFAFKPDYLFCWNSMHADQATRFQNIQRKSIKIVGSPFFDKWFEDSPGQIDQPTSTELAYSVNGKPYILYLGSSGNIAKNEIKLVKEVIQAAESRNLGVWVRPHPANSKPFDELIGVKDVLVYPRCGRLPEKSQDVLEMRKAFQSSKLLIGINTSAFIDAVLLDCPTAIFESGEYKLTQSMAEHFQVISQSGACYTVNSKISILNLIDMLDSGSDPKSIHRKAFINSMIFPNCKPGEAGDVIAKQILGIIKQ